MASKQLFSWIGMIVILIAGLIHLSLAPNEYQDTPYMGVLFVIYFLGSIISAIGIYRGELIWGWMLGGVLSIAAVLGYLVTRTVGLPITGIEDWGPSTANLALFLEILFFAPCLRCNLMHYGIAS